MKINTKIVLLLALVASGFCESVVAQTLRLREQGSNSKDVSAQAGQTITVEVIGELTGVEAAGFSLFVTVPEDQLPCLANSPQTHTG